MNSAELSRRLYAFQLERKIVSKGALAVVVHLSRFARENGLPLLIEQLITEGTGQVHGLGRASVQRVLKDYGIQTILAEEGGRTSRGSLGTMRYYVEFLNVLHNDGLAELEKIEAWWIERVKEHFCAKPFRLRFDPAKGFQAIIQDLLAQAKKRQQEQSGTMVQGAMLQHLVGAKLELAVPEIAISHNGFSVSDAVSNR